MDEFLHVEFTHHRIILGKIKNLKDMSDELQKTLSDIEDLKNIGYEGRFLI